MLTHRANAQADRRAEQEEPGDNQYGEAEPDHQVEVAEHVLEEVAESLRRNRREEPEMDVRDRCQVDGSAVVAVDVVVEVAGDPQREEVDGRSADDLVCAQVNREERVDEPEGAPGEDSDENAQRP